MKKSVKTHAVIDTGHGLRKAKKIMSVFRAFMDPRESRTLDIGTGSGVIASLLGPEMKSMVSVDINDERIVFEGYSFKRCSDTRLPFPDGSFDLVISNHVIEHIPEQAAHLSEILRVLRPGGYCYLATPNRWWFMETHFRIPLLSWFPRQVSGMFTKVLKGREYDIHPLGWKGLRKLCRGFKVYNVSAMVIKRPKTFNLDILPGMQPVTRMMPRAVIERLAFIYPTFIVMLQKPGK